MGGLMNKTAIKNFAIWARNKLIADISYRAGLMGISEEGISAALPQSTISTEFYDIGTENPYSISGDAIKQRRKLVEVIRRKEEDTDYQAAYKYIIEEVAYTWFNRLIAIHFMEVNDYLPSNIRVLSSETGKIEPDIVTNPFDAELEFTDEEREKIIQLKTENQLDELFRILFIKQCNALNEYLPALFEKTNDYTELLLNISVIDRDGVVYKLVHDISEDDFNIEKGGQVEIIGWLYQYYNTEPKAEVFGRPSGTKIRKEDVPAATQLFTPDWIVRYMVENSLGRLWVEGHPNDELKANWKYYLEEVAQEPEVEEKLAEIRKEYAKLNPEDIKLIDPCMGSGHILVYAFDVLMQIYESAGYGQRDAAGSILENNIYGLDIDDRAFQLAYFAVMMKARQYNRRILTGEYKPNLYSIKESNGVNRNHLKYFGKSLNESDKDKALSQMNSLLDTFIDAKEYGSILTVGEYDWDLLERFVSDSEYSGQISMETVGIEDTKESLLQMIAQGKVLEQKYWVAVTNPPYAGSSNLSAKVNNYLKKNYPDSKSDLFAVFIEKCSGIVDTDGIVAMITMHSFMFLSSFQNLRYKFLENNLISLIHLGIKAFDEVGNDVVQTASFVFRMTLVKEYKSVFSRLVECKDQDLKKTEYLRKKYLSIAKCLDFYKIPSYTFAYWVPHSFIENYSSYPNLETMIDIPSLNKTGDNEKYLRCWWEVERNKVGVNWIFYSKGGDFKRFYGNLDIVIDWSSSARKFYKDNKTSNLISEKYWYKEGIMYSAVTSRGTGFRYLPPNCVYDMGGPAIIINDEKRLMEVLALLNSSVATYYFNVMNPSINLQTKDIKQLPFIEDKSGKVVCLAKENLSIAREAWDYEETSKDFSSIYFDKTVEHTYKNIFNRQTSQAKSFEINFVEINKIYSHLYNIEDKFLPTYEFRDNAVEITNKKRLSKSVLSYAVGCMFGRYSLDTEGLAYAGGEWDKSKYDKFKPDNDNIIPITDEEYLEDDIITRLCTWLKVVYGEDTLEENLDFIAGTLGNRGNTSREIIRNYFLNDFFKDHCQIYSVTGSGKRPIYWLFDSGKQNGFKALIYLHRYNADTIGNLRIDYLHHMQRIYESESNRMQDTIDHSTNAREVATASKRREKLQKQLKECREYDEKVAHLALSRIELDLDDGVKVNYRKLQTAADGKFYEVLADSKSIMSKK